MVRLAETGLGRRAHTLTNVATPHVRRAHEASGADFAGKASVLFLDRPRWREAAFGHCGGQRHPHLSNVSFLILIFVKDRLRRCRPRVQGAKAAITCNHVRGAFPDRTVLAVPVHVSA